MSTKTLVVVLQGNGSTHGKVSEFHDAQDAEHFVEGLLEAGFAERSIRVLAVQSLDLIITHRPAVSLVPAHLASRDAPAAHNSAERLWMNADLPATTHVATFESPRERDLAWVGASPELKSSGYQVNLTPHQGSPEGRAASDVESIWAPTGDGAELVVADDLIPEVSRR